MDQRTNSPIVNEYILRTPNSAALARDAGTRLPSGIAHDARYTTPYGIFVERAEASRKWDVDGHDYVDYFGGHGALLLGHAHPEVEAAVVSALKNGTHFGSNHPGEVAWAEIVQRLVPSAERVRFTASGTEATHMALRLARAYTGRHKLLRFRTHFHGWHDHMAFGVSDHFDGSPGPGVLPQVSGEVVLVDPGDTDQVAAALKADPEIAAVILEPTGSACGMVPIRPEFLTALRELTAAHGSLLIFDEVVTGFRVAPGGAQALYGITPDLTTLAKILAGGLPGGAVVGTKAILDRLDFEVAAAEGFEKIHHPGTYNANPVSAAAGNAALAIVEGGAPCEAASNFGDRLRGRLNEVFASHDLAWAAYGEHSTFHIFMNPAARPIDPLAFDPYAVPFAELRARPLGNKTRLAMLIHGVDVTASGGGNISCTHGDSDLERTVEAYDQAIAMLKAEEQLPGR